MVQVLASHTKCRTWQDLFRGESGVSSLRPVQSLAILLRPNSQGPIPGAGGPVTWALWRAHTFPISHWTGKAFNLS